MLLKPNELRGLLANDVATKRACAVARDNWQSLDEQGLFGGTKITIADVQLAKRLLAAGLTNGAVDFNAYQSVQRFTVKNANALATGTKQLLLAPFA